MTQNTVIVFSSFFKVETLFYSDCLLPFRSQQLVQAGMGTHFPSTGYSPTAPSVGPEGLSVAVAVKNATINEPLHSHKSDANTQQQPNISAALVRINVKKN
jgi:hypothetical protein